MEQKPVRPLQLSKSMGDSPGKMATRSVLTDISPMGIRRNSPSFKLQSSIISQGFSPQDQGYSAHGENSKKISMQIREDGASPSHSMERKVGDLQVSEARTPSRRSSLEKLEKASRVRNSNIFLRDGLSGDDSSNVSKFGSFPFFKQREVPLLSNHSMILGQEHSHSTNKPLQSGNGTGTMDALSARDAPNYQKRTFDQTRRAWTEEEDVLVGRGLEQTAPANRRLAKTVSFDAGPPQVNEYEMVTPDLSSIASDSREGSHESIEDETGSSPIYGLFHDENEDSFDESLEDIQKTPIVPPEEVCSQLDGARDTGMDVSDGFNRSQGAHEQTVVSSGDKEIRERFTEDNSIDTMILAESSIRPLPPLPGIDMGHGQNSKLSLDAESSRASSLPRFGSPRFQPPRPASVSKAEIIGMRESPMPLGERLRLLELQDSQKKPVENQDLENDISTCNTTSSNLTDESSIPKTNQNKAPRISRESVLRNVDSHDTSDKTKVYDRHALDYSNIDPDIPVISSEITPSHRGLETKQSSKLEDHGDHRLQPESSYVSEIATALRSSDSVEELTRESSVIHYTGTDEESLRSISPHEEYERDDSVPCSQENFEGEISTPPEFVEDECASLQSADGRRTSLPEFLSFFDEDDFGLSLRSYLTPPPVDPLQNITLASCGQHPSASAQSQAGESIRNEATPTSTHLAGVDAVSHDELVIPERDATIRAPGSTLKTRPSLGGREIIPGASIGDEEPTDKDVCCFQQTTLGQDVPCPTSDNLDEQERGAMRIDVTEAAGEKPAMLVPVEIEGIAGELGLDKEFDRLLEAKNKGYLTRQNTKVVVASSRVLSSEHQQVSTEKKSGTPLEIDKIGEDPGKLSSSSKVASQSWTTEPWNGRMRRQSTRKSLLVPGKRLPGESLSPLLELQSNTSFSSHGFKEAQLLEDPGRKEAEEEEEEGEEERGRLFVKVLGLNSLELPLAPDEKSWFQLTLDNGLHCVTTTWLELNNNAPIGQEFELTVFTDLDFQLTLQMKLDRPKSQTNSISREPVVDMPKTQKPSALSRFLSSPKKRRELDQKQKLGLQAGAKKKLIDRQAQIKKRHLTAWDLVHELVGPDGSFARSYVSLKDFEPRAFGRPFHTVVPCYNEWAIEDKIASESTRSKLGGVQRKPPYRIGTLELQLLYVPRPKGARDEELPQSMSACIKQLKSAEDELLRTTTWEGFLSQQGGDCPYWRRRFFRLDDRNLISYHETTRQRRANINLSKATKLIDDRSTLTQSNSSPSRDGRRRRKSAFAEEEEGYMFVEEGFRIRFSNGEIIDFYADNAKEKSDWMRALCEVIGKGATSERLTWTKLVLAKESTNSTRLQQEMPNQLAIPGVREEQPVAKPRPQSMMASSVATDQMGPNPASSRNAVKSMIL